MDEQIFPATGPRAAGESAAVDSVDAQYRQLVELLEAGRFADLQAAAARLVAQQPGHGKAHKLLGLAGLVAGDGAAALGPLQRAHALVSDDAEITDFLGCAYNLLGRYGEAAASFEQSLALDGQRPETWTNIGKNRREMGDAPGAADAYRRAIAMNPRLVQAYSNLSVILCETGRPAEALQVLDQAVALSPTEPWVHLHRGNALKDLKRIDEAVAAYDRALQIAPGLHEGWNNLADALQLQGDTAQALAAAERALALNPDDPEVLNTLGTLYAIKKRPREAEAMLRRALTLRPDNAIYWLNLAGTLDAIDARIACHRRALELRPDFDQALSQLLFCLNYLPTTTPQSMVVEARAYGDMLAARIAPRQAWSNERTIGRPLRIGVVSADLCEHPASYFFESTLQAFRDKPHVWVAYSNVETEDAMTARYRTLFHEWCDVQRLTDDQLAARIVDDRIDILIDLSGHSAGHRLPVFARKPAPVQVAWVGYFATTGLSTIDWIIVDPWSVRPGEEANYTEQVWRLPETRFCFTPPHLEIDVAGEPRASDAPPLLGCFNTLTKCTDEVLALWGRVMVALPDARLLIKAKQMDDESARLALAERLRRVGIDPARVVMEGPSRREEYLRTYQRIDFCLDTFPFTGGTTTAEALWMGVPVLTLQGDSLVSRQGASMMNNVGLGDWVAADADDYVRKAVRFAADRAGREQIRRSLRARGAASPLGNPVWFANQLETAFRGMWRRYCEAR